VDTQHQQSARKLKQLSSKYSRNQDLINVGAYVPGADAILDEAIQKRTMIESFLQQDFATQCNTQDSIDQLNQIIGQQG
jgi:flagellum-specific ATP synthase